MILTLSKLRLQKYIFNWYFLNIFLISSIFFITFVNVFFSRNFSPIVTNVQNVWSILTFSVSSFVWLWDQKSKIFILSKSSCVWVNASNSEFVSSSRVMLHKMHKWYWISMSTDLIWGYSNFKLTPKLKNKQCFLSISRPSCFQRMKSRK